MKLGLPQKKLGVFLKSAQKNMNLAKNYHQKIGVVFEFTH